MGIFIEAKVKFSKMLDNGKVKEVNEPYLVKALSFTEAEARVTEAVRPYISDAFTVSAVTKSNVAEVFYDDAGDRWYKVKANFIRLNEKTNAEKLTSSYYLVQALDFHNALENFLDGMKGTISDFTIGSISETKIMDVID